MPMAIGSEGDRQSGGAGAGDEMCSRGPGCAAMILHSTRRSETRHRGFSGLAPLALGWRHLMFRLILTRAVDTVPREGGRR